MQIYNLSIANISLRSKKTTNNQIATSEAKSIRDNEFFYTKNPINADASLAFCGLFKKDNIKKDIPPEVLQASIEIGSNLPAPSANRLINIYSTRRSLPMDFAKASPYTMKKYAKLLKSRVGSIFADTSFFPPIVPLLNSIKDNSGKFNIKNEELFYSLLPEQYPYYMMDSINPGVYADVINQAKDENGVVSDDKLKVIKDIKTYSDDPKTILKNIVAYNNIPFDKRESVYDILSCVGMVKKNDLYNFPKFAAFCLDEKSNIDPKKLSFCESLSTFEMVDIPDEAFNLANKYPKLMEFISDFCKYTSFSSEEIKELESCIELYLKEDGELDENFKENFLKYVLKIGDTSKFNDIYLASFDLDAQNFNQDVFDVTLAIASPDEQNSRLPYLIKPDLAFKIANGTFDVSDCDFEKRIMFLNTLTTMASNMPEVEALNRAINILRKSLIVEDKSLPIKEIDKQNFISEVLYSTQGEYTEFENVLIDSIPLLETMHDGLKISYPRSKFLSDFSNICKTSEKIDEVAKKMNIKPLYFFKNELYGYDGIINHDNLDLNDEVEKQIYDITQKFLYENNVQTENKKLNDNLNYIIKAFPEFINIIGKEQHSSHDYTLDIHSLLVLANSLANPFYIDELSENDKAVLKLTTIFHDIAKKQGEVTPEHPQLSAQYSTYMLDKVISNTKTKDRIKNLIDSHHWLQKYNGYYTKCDIAREIAFDFRIPNDFLISKIITHADLKSASGKLYETYSCCLKPKFLNEIQKNLDYFHSSGCAIFADKFIDPSKMDNFREYHEGYNYKVLNLKQIPNDAHMSRFGFEHGIRKKDLMLLVHMIAGKKVYADLESLKYLCLQDTPGVLSESLITPKYPNTYYDRIYGVMVSHSNYDIASISESNQHSGVKKNNVELMYSIFSDEDQKMRFVFRNSLLKNLRISSYAVSDEDFAKFYSKVIGNKTSLSQFIPDKIYTLGQYLVSGKEIQDAILDFQDDLINKVSFKHNEIVAYQPKIEALIAKADHISQLPEEFLRFARENDYTIILI